MRSSFLLAAASLLSLCACDSQRAESVTGEAGNARISLKASPLGATVAARASAAEPGGKLVVTLTNPVLLTSRSDTLAWGGADTLRSAFEGLQPGSGYRLAAHYLDVRGLVTHRDSTGPFTLGPGQDLALALRMGAVLGKIYLQFPSVPAGVKQLGLEVSAGGRSWKTSVQVAGRGALRLDSLPLGVSLRAELRAYDSLGAALYKLDTAVTLSGTEDLALAWIMGAAGARTAGSLVFLEGGEASASVGFAGLGPSPQAQTGRLLLTGLSDSGGSDWVRITNPGAAFSGNVKLARGTADDTTFLLTLGAGESRIVTKASGEILAQPGHPLGGIGATTGRIATVTWTSTTSVVWTLRSADGAVLHDMVFVLSANVGWPLLNASTARTLVLRKDALGALANDAGSNWCALATDSPSASCP